MRTVDCNAYFCTISKIVIDVSARVKASQYLGVCQFTIRGRNNRRLVSRTRPLKQPRSTIPQLQMDYNPPDPALIQLSASIDEEKSKTKT